jgi:hypothetical protein
MEKIKTCDKMNFSEFTLWAKEVMIRNFLKKGLDGLDDAAFMIVDQTCRNEVFGGAKPIQKNKK